MLSRKSVFRCYVFCYTFSACSYDSDFLNTRVRRTNIMYGGLRPELRKVIFTNGDVDPWHALSVLEDLNEASPAILIKGNAMRFLRESR